MDRPRYQLYQIEIGTLLEDFWFGGPKIMTKRTNSWPKAILLLFMFFLLSGFQNCTKHAFVNQNVIDLQSLNVESFRTQEDTELIAQPKSLQSEGLKSNFTVTRQPNSGAILEFNSSSGQFRYKPNSNFFGEDYFDVVESFQQDGKTKTRDVKLYILVTSVNDLPWIVEDAVSFEVNSNGNVLNLTGRDLEDPKPQILLSQERISTAATQNGTLLQTQNGPQYTPAPGFRGTDQFEFTVMDSSGDWSKKKVSIIVGNPFHSVEPAIAARAVGCTSCHANINSKLVTDFGHGTANVFFGKDVNTPFGSIYGDHTDIANSGYPSWTTTSLFDEVFVPKANFDFKWQDYLSSYPALLNRLIYKTTSLTDYLRAAEVLKSSEKQKAKAIVEKDEIFISGMTPSKLRTKLGISGSINTKYWKNDPATSPALTGLGQNGSGYFTNENGQITCDGDIFIEGTLFLKDLALKTSTGCRIHSTGPIFVQGAITYENLGTGSNLTNLQLVSARAVILGIGYSHCESASNPGWYADKAANFSPIDFRFFEHDIPKITRNTNSTQSATVEQTSSDWKAEGRFVANEARKIASLKDASCGSSREVHFERLLINAPQVQSRYTGNFKGVIITEIPLFSLSRFKYEFDPVFKNVSVLPFFDQRDYFFVR